MTTTRLLLALDMAGPSSAALARGATNEAISLHWDRASKRIIHHAQEKIACEQAGPLQLPTP